MGQSEFIFEEIYDIWYTPWWQTSLGYGSILGIGLLCLVFFGVLGWWLRKRSITPQQRAIKELRALFRYAINDRQSTQQIYRDMTVSLKKYIAARYSASLNGATDYECILLLKKLLVSDSVIMPIDNLMRNAQEVKFARNMVLAKQIKEDIGQALLFVEQTAPDHEQNR